MKRRSHAQNQYAGTAPLGNGVLEELHAILGEALQLDVPDGKLSTPETRLMADVLLQAIVESCDNRNAAAATKLRVGARAWLTEAPGFTAREACDAVGIEYQAMMKVLRGRWTA